MFKSLGEKFFQLMGERSYGIKGPSMMDQAWDQMASFYKVCDLFPYDSYDERNQLFLNDDSVGFVIETLPLVGASDAMQKQISNLFQSVLPDESALQILLWSDPHIGYQCDRFKNYRHGQSAMLCQIAERRAEYLKSLAFNSPFKPYCLRNFRCVVSFSKKVKSVNDFELESIRQLLEQIQTTLEMLKLPVQIWTPHDLINTLHGILNLKPDETSPWIRRWNPLQRLSDQLSCAESNLRVDDSLLAISDNQVMVKTYSVQQYPDIWSLHAMGQLIGDEDSDQAQIPCPFLIHYGVYIPKQDSPKNTVMTKAAYVEKQAYSPLGKYLPSIQREAEELAFVREQLGRGERIVQTQLSVTLFAHGNLLASAEQILKNLFVSKEWRLESNRFLHLPLFLSQFPMMWGEERVKGLASLNKLKTTLSTESANLLPIQGEWHGTQTPGMVLAGRRGQLFTWSPFDREGNYNTCVVGKSGTGKSVFMQELVTSILGVGGKVFVMDVGRSFEKTCFLLEGQFIEFRSNTQLCLNPFSTIPTDSEEAAIDALDMLKPILALMVAPTQGVGDKGIALLEQATLHTWKQKGQASTMTDIAAWLQNHSDPEAKDLGTMLFPYTLEGNYGRFFNGPATVNLENPLVVVELDGLQGRKDLQSVVLQMMIVNITNQMVLRDRDTPFAIVIDEAWNLMRGEKTGEFIEALARTLRKYKGSLVIGTQSVNDFFTKPGALAAFENSDWLCLLGQKHESIAALKKQERLSLTPQKEVQLKSLRTEKGKYAEVMIASEDGYAIGRLLLDPYSLLLYSTKAEDFEAVRRLKEQGYSINDAIESLLQSEHTQKRRAA